MTAVDEELSPKLAARSHNEVPKAVFDHGTEDHAFTAGDYDRRNLIPNKRFSNNIFPQAEHDFWKQTETAKAPFSSSPRKKTTQHTSGFFDSSAQEKVATVKFPPLDASQFGLAQEQYSYDPFKLLVAVLFLNKTRGTVSMPLCEKLFALYPNPLAFASANVEELTGLIRPLGLQKKRAKSLVCLGQAWLQNPPQKGKRYRSLHYPSHGDGKGIQDEPISDDDPRVAWEIAHLPTVGRYALDSWRIFCRDKLRGMPSGLVGIDLGVDMRDEKGQEWTSVLPKDKELRAYIKWRWLRLGYLWDPLTGHKVQVGLDNVQKMERKEFKSFRGYSNPWILGYSSNDFLNLDSKIREELKIDEETLSFQDQQPTQTLQPVSNQKVQIATAPASNKSSQASSSEADRRVVDEAISILEGDGMIEALSSPHHIENIRG